MNQIHSKTTNSHINPVDLHVHSTKSDGTLSPAELVDYAVKKGLAAIAITDHDTTDGIDEALLAAQGKHITVIPGIEFSTEFEGKDIHILGLFIDHNNPFFKERLERFVYGRMTRNQEMCEKLRGAGIDITYEKLSAEFPDSVLTRAHVAGYLLNHGYVKNYKEAFERFVGDDRPFFVPRKKITPFRAVEIILKAGGLPILAHPLLYHMSDARLDRLVAELAAAGLAGIEAVYSSHAPAEERQMKKLASKYQLPISGGSDYHGMTKPGLDMGTGYGKLFIPENILTDLLLELDKRRSDPDKYRPRKILFTDLDGTLLDDSKQIGSYTREILDAWSEAGHRLVLCSGRDINSVRNVKENLGLHYPGMVLIGSNGGQVYDCDKKEILYKVSLTNEQITRIMDIAREQDIFCISYTDTQIVFPRSGPELDHYLHAIQLPFLIAEDVAACVPDGAGKCLAVELEDHSKLEKFRDSVLDFAEGKITLMFSSQYYLELISADAGKGASLKKLCEILGIPKALSVAAGDHENDISMLQAAGFSIALCNGIAAARAAATVVTDFDNNHDGLAHVLSSLL